MSNITRRKLQFAGNSSFVLTLPKQWVSASGLNRSNAQVIIEEIADGSLRISPQEVKNQIEDSELTIFVKPDQNGNEIIRLILAGYLASKSIIIIKPEKQGRLSSGLLIKIDNLVQKLWGSEIISTSVDRVEINDALDPSQMKINEIIEKAFFTAENMIENALNAVKEKNKELAEYVVRTENTLDKLYYYSLRQLYKASSNVMFASKIGILPRDVIDYHLTIKNIERMGDHAEQISEMIISGRYAKNIDELYELGTFALETCRLAVVSFKLNDSFENAQKAIEMKDEIKNRYDTINFSLEDFPFTKSILRIADYASDIAELIINRKIGIEN